MSEQQTAQLSALGAALIAAILDVVARIDPDGVLSNRGMQDGVVAIFTASVPFFVALAVALRALLRAPQTPQEPPAELAPPPEPQPPPSLAQRNQGPRQ